MSVALGPASGRVIALGAVLAVATTSIPALVFGTPVHILLAVGAVIAAAAVLFSTRRSLAAMLVVTAILPMSVVGVLPLPAGLRPWELVLVGAFVFSAIDLVRHDNLRLRRSRVDGLVLALLGVGVVGAFIGFWHGYEAVFRNSRYVFYYAAFFVVLQGVDRRDITGLFVPVLILSGAAVSVQYVLEFLGAIDLSTGEKFVRIGGRRGIVLPLTLLLLANWMVHDPRRWGRGPLMGLFLITGLGFGITLGRGMWAAFGLGLVTSVWLWHRGQPVEQRRPWKGILLSLGLVLTLTATVLAFQRVTGSSISAHALERSRTFVDYSRDIQVLSRLLNYATALGVIADHPLLGAGQGATVTSYSFDPETNRFETWTAWTLDSLYLTLWLKLGLAGLLLFPWLCLRIGQAAWRVFQRSRDPGERAFCASAVAILAGMTLLGLSDGSMINGRFAAHFAVLFGLVMVLDVDTEQSPEPQLHTQPQETA